MEIGDWVTYDDEDPDTTSFRGHIVEPNELDLRNALDNPDGGIGPEFGDVLVEWREEGLPYSRYWEHPSYLQKLEGIDSELCN